MKMKKSELRQMIREVLEEELSKKASTPKSINEGLEETEVFLSHTIGENIRVAGKDVALAKKLDYEADSIWHEGEQSDKSENYGCAKYGISSWSGIELFDKLADDAGLTYEIEYDEY
jgi:hypothetical protein